MHKFNTSALPTYDDGRLAAALDSAIRNALLDLEDRPGLKTARKIQLELQLVPRVIDTERECDSAELTWSVALKAPRQERGGCVLAVYRGGVGGYSPNSIDNPDQQTIFDNEENDDHAEGSH